MRTPTTKTTPAKVGGRINQLTARLEVALMLIADKSPGGYLTKWIKPKYHGRKLMEVKG